MGGIILVLWLLFDCKG